MRIIPRNNEEVNEDWISDKARFQYDGLKRQRLNIPLVKDEQGAFTSALWPEALTKVCPGQLEAAGFRSCNIVLFCCQGCWRTLSCGLWPEAGVVGASLPQASREVANCAFCSGQDSRGVSSSAL